MKRRVSASVDEDLLDAVEAAVRAGRAPSVSALIENGIRRELEREARHVAWQDFVAFVEAEHGGPITDEERAEARADLRRRTRTPQEILAEMQDRAA